MAKKLRIISALGIVATIFSWSIAPIRSWLDPISDIGPDWLWFSMALYLSFILATMAGLVFLDLIDRISMLFAKL